MSPSHRLLILIVLPLSTSAVRISYRAQEDTSVLDPVFEDVSFQANGTQTEIGKVSKVQYHGIRIATVGWKKTGTTSMQKAYEVLGIKPVGANRVCKTPSCMRFYAGVEDAYVCCNHALVNAIKERYAADHVKFVLTERSPSKWKASIDAWVGLPSKGHKNKKEYGELMGAEFGSKEFYKGYEFHNAFIKALFRDEPDRLLVLNLEEDDPIENMQRFCKFVNVPEYKPVCKQPFPHTNANHHDAVGDRQEISDFWLSIDNDEHEFDRYDSRWATFDWMQWYKMKGLDLKSDLMFEADNFD